MAQHFYGITIPGAKFGDVATGTSTTSKVLEVSITDGTAGVTKAEVLKGLEVLADYIATHNNPA